MFADIVSHAVREWRRRSGRPAARSTTPTRTANETLTEAWEAALEDADIRSRLNDIVSAAEQAHDRLAPKVTELNVALAAAFGPLVAEYETLRDELERIAQGLHVDLPDRPEGEVPDVDTDDYLFDSSRDYFDQLAAYHAHKNGRRS